MAVSAVGLAPSETSILLSQELKSYTAVAHAAAEGSMFIAELIDGRLDAAAFVSLLDQNLIIYRALETAVAAHSDHTQLGPFLDSKLARSSALEADMAYHHGADWEAQLVDGRITIVPATLAYAEALLSMGSRSIEFLLAHHYVRYLGDLSGGLIIARMIQRHYKIADEGLNFYAFPEIAKPKPYKDGYRDLLDTTNFNRAQKDAILNFAAESFELNRAVFIDLAAARSAGA